MPCSIYAFVQWYFLSPFIKSSLSNLVIHGKFTPFLFLWQNHCKLVLICFSTYFVMWISNLLLQKYVLMAFYFNSTVWQMPWARWQKFFFKISNYIEIKQNWNYLSLAAVCTWHHYPDYILSVLGSAEESLYLYRRCKNALAFVACVTKKQLVQYSTLKRLIMLLSFRLWVKSIQHPF